MKNFVFGAAPRIPFQKRSLGNAFAAPKRAAPSAKRSNAVNSPPICDLSFDAFNVYSSNAPRPTAGARVEAERADEDARSCASVGERYGLKVKLRSRVASLQPSDAPNSPKSAVFRPNADSVRASRFGRADAPTAVFSERKVLVPICFAEQKAKANGAFSQRLIKLKTVSASAAASPVADRSAQQSDVTALHALETFPTDIREIENNSIFSVSGNAWEERKAKAACDTFPLFDDAETPKNDFQSQKNRFDEFAFKQSNGCETETFEVELPNVGLYIGQLQNGQMHGRGKLIDANGETLYEGQFENNKFEGMAKLFNPSASPIALALHPYADLSAVANCIAEYNGQFANNRFQGLGTLRYAFGAEFCGQFREGKAEGIGEWKWNAQRFNGFWRADKLVSKA